MQKHVIANKAKRKKQEGWLQQIEDRFKGNPLLKDSVDTTVPMTKQDIKNLKYLDNLGNPIKGYKWIKTKKGIAKVVKV